MARRLRESDLKASRVRPVKICFQYFAYVYHPPFPPHLMTDLRNAAAIHSVFYANLISDVMDANEISQLIISELNTKNTLGKVVKEYNLNRKTSRFHSIIDIQLQDFPILTEKDLHLIALGHYQLNQAKCYYLEHISPYGKFKIKLCTDVTHIDFASYEMYITYPIFLKARTQSQHVHETKYYIYILVDKNVEEIQKEYYCTCKNNACTMGCCVHIIMVIWFFGGEATVRIRRKHFYNVWHFRWRVSFWQTSIYYIITHTRSHVKRFLLLLYMASAVHCYANHSCAPGAQFGTDFFFNGHHSIF